MPLATDRNPSCRNIEPCRVVVRLGLQGPGRARQTARPGACRRLPAGVFVDARRGDGYPRDKPQRLLLGSPMHTTCIILISIIPSMYSIILYSTVQYCNKLQVTTTNNAPANQTLRLCAQ